MNKKAIAIILVIIGTLGLMFLAGRTAPRPSVVAPSGLESELVVSEKLYDFGTISMKDGYAIKDFVVSNSTEKDIFVPSLVTSCMCTKAFLVESDGSTKGPFGMPGMGYVPPANETIKAGESQVVRVVYDPNAHGPAGVGPIRRAIILTDDTGGTLNLEIKAMVTP